MATQLKEIIRAVMTLHDGPPPILNVPEGNSQTFVKGEIVDFAFGYVKEISSDTPSAIYGVAAASGSNDSTAETDNDVEVPVELAMPDTLFEANMLETGLANHVLAASDLGVTMGIQRDTTNSKVFLNASVKAGSGVRVFVHRVARDSAIGDTNARVLFSFLPNFIRQLGTS